MSWTFFDSVLDKKGKILIHPRRYRLVPGKLYPSISVALSDIIQSNAAAVNPKPSTHLITHEHSIDILTVVVGLVMDLGYGLLGLLFSQKR